MLTLPWGPRPPFLWPLKTEPLEMPSASGCGVAVADCGVENQGGSLEPARGRWDTAAAGLAYGSRGLNRILSILLLLLGCPGSSCGRGRGAAGPCCGTRGESKISF